MSDDSSSVNDAPEINADALERWVTNMANEKAVSEQELLDEVLSSYWVLEELADIIVAHSSEEVELERHDDLPTERANQDVTDRQNTPDHRNPDQTPSDPQNDVSGTESIDVSGLKHELTELRTAIEQISEDTSPETTRNQRQSADLAELLTEISSLRSGEATQSREATKPPESNRFRKTARSPNATQPAGNTAHNTVSNERLDELETRLQELENQFSDTLTDTISELEQRISDTKESDADFQSEINAEFEEIENVLDHLLEATSDMDNRLESVSQTHQAEIEQLQDYRSTQNQLETLKSDAIKHGISSASCGSCTQTIDLSLLESPFCPSCDSMFSDISPGSWVPFDTATLHVGSNPSSQTENSP